jgi:Spy/CpxP family protein refolding chaperone
METSGKSRWQIRLAVLIIFVIGFAAGALAMNFYRARSFSSSPQNMHGRFDRIIDRLNLTPDQEAEVRAIFDEARAQLTEIRKESEPRFREVRRHTNERLQAVLRPEQWDQFQQMTDESKGRRSRKRDRAKEQP